jgi:hypothetical protein
MMQDNSCPELGCSVELLDTFSLDPLSMSAIHHSIEHLGASVSVDGQSVCVPPGSGAPVVDVLAATMPPYVGASPSAQHGAHRLVGCNAGVPSGATTVHHHRGRENAPPPNPNPPAGVAAATFYEPWKGGVVRHAGRLLPSSGGGGAGTNAVGPAAGGRAGAAGLCLSGITSPLKVRHAGGHQQNQALATAPASALQGQCVFPVAAQMVKAGAPSPAATGQAQAPAATPVFMAAQCAAPARLGPGFTRRRASAPSQWFHAARV